MADLLSLARIPLGILFVLVAHRFVPAAVVIALAGLTDVLDGPIARHQLGANRHMPHRGDWLDPLCDKFFIAAVVLGLWLAVRPPWPYALLVLTRELLQAVFMVGFVGIRAVSGHRFEYPYRAHPLGKLTTVVQFATVFAMLARHPATFALAACACVMGVASAALYLMRARRLVSA